MTSGKFHYRTCALCHVQKHPDDTHVFGPGELGARAIRVCWNCIGKVVEHLSISDELAKLKLRKKVA